MPIHVEWDDAARGYRVTASEEIQKCSQELRSMHTDARHAATFRDIGRYTHWEKREDGVIEVQYPAGWRGAKVDMELRERPGAVAFTTVGNDPLVSVDGEWTFETLGSHSTRVSLRQIVRPVRVPAWVPLGRMLRGRVRRG